MHLQSFLKLLKITTVTTLQKCCRRQVSCLDSYLDALQLLLWRLNGSRKLCPKRVQLVICMCEKDLNWLGGL